MRSFGRAAGYGSGRLLAQAWSDSEWLPLFCCGEGSSSGICEVARQGCSSWMHHPMLAPSIRGSGRQQRIAVGSGQGCSWLLVSLAAGVSMDISLSALSS